MSPEKLEKALAAVLREFSPWADPERDHYWFGLAPSTVPLSPVLQPYSIFLAFVTFSGYAFYGRTEKIAWSIPVRFKNAGFVISHQKFGLRIHPPNSQEYSPELGNQLIKQLTYAVKIVDGLIKPLSIAQIRAGNASIANKLHFHQGRYEFFRERAEERFKAALSPVDVKSADGIKLGTGNLAMEFNRKARANREGYYYATAALDGYFSYLEHLLVLMLPFCGYDPAKDDLIEILNSSWSEKWKRVFDHDADGSAERAYHQLVKIKEKFRNPLSHGGFDKDGASAYFHVPGLGALPATMSRFADSIQFGVDPIGPSQFEEICATLDKTDLFFQTSPLRLAFHCVSSGVDVSFDAASIRRFVGAMASAELMEQFIDHRLTDMDNAANMDW